MSVVRHLILLCINYLIHFYLIYPTLLTSLTFYFIISNLILFSKLITSYLFILSKYFLNFISVYSYSPLFSCYLYCTITPPFNSVLLNYPLYSSIPIPLQSDLTYSSPLLFYPFLAFSSCPFPSPLASQF